jgi:hypothetical protein
MAARNLYILTDQARIRLLERDIEEEWIVRILSSPELLELDSEDSTKRHAFYDCVYSIF